MKFLDKILNIINNLFRKKKIKRLEATKEIISTNENYINNYNPFKESLEVEPKIITANEKNEPIIETLKCIHDRFRISKIQKNLKECIFMEKIKIAICGYGNLGRGIEKEIEKSKDMELVGIFTRRNPNSLQIASDTPVIGIKEFENWKDKVDVMIMCGGSATDLPEQVPAAAKLFNTVDSFDTHAKIPEYYERVNESATSANKTSVISGGWDPGMFSLMRLYADSILPNGKTYTFWGKGVSQGHSDAIRRIEGVKDARQYTIPIEDAMNRVREGENPELATGEKHLRECFVVAEDGADTAKIENEIKTMPNYFDEYKTTVHFITEEELKKNHSKMSHGGFVIHSGETGDGNKHIIEYSLKLDSNPEFTSSVLLALARATFRMNKNGWYGAKTIFDIPPAYFSEKSGEELRKELL